YAATTDQSCVLPYNKGDFSANLWLRKITYNYAPSSDECSGVASKLFSSTSIFSKPVSMVSVGDGFIVLFPHQALSPQEGNRPMPYYMLRLNRSGQVVAGPVYLSLPSIQHPQYSLNLIGVDHVYDLVNLLPGTNGEAIIQRDDYG